MKKVKFKLTPQVHKYIVETALTLPVLVRQNADGTAQYRKLATYKGATDLDFNYKTYTKHSSINMVPVYLNHKVKMIETYELYGETALQKYIDEVYKINNASQEKIKPSVEK